MTQLPQTASDWSSFAKNLSATFQTNRNIALKPTKLQHDIAQALGFTNWHVMKDSLTSTQTSSDATFQFYSLSATLHDDKNNCLGILNKLIGSESLEEAKQQAESIIEEKQATLHHVDRIETKLTLSSAEDYAITHLPKEITLCENWDGEICLIEETIDPNAKYLETPSIPNDLPMLDQTTLEAIRSEYEVTWLICEMPNISKYGVHEYSTYSGAKELFDILGLTENPMFDIRAECTGDDSGSQVFLILKRKEKKVKNKKADELEINQEIVFSTAHISESDNNNLQIDEASPKNLIVYSQGAYGYRIAVNHTNPSAIDVYSKEFMHLIQQAIDHQCEYLILDCDANLTPNLPTFDW